MFNPLEREFEFKQGAIFANIVIADEINRSSPKTQSALLEAMEEQQVTVDGHSHPLPAPFLVVATQNPLEMEGTYALPEAQRDRFMMRISMGYPDARSEALMLRQRDSVNPLEAIRGVVTGAEVSALIAWARAVHVAPTIEDYAVALAQADPQPLRSAARGEPARDAAAGAGGEGVGGPGRPRVRHSGRHHRPPHPRLRAPPDPHPLGRRLAGAIGSRRRDR